VEKGRRKRIRLRKAEDRKKKIASVKLPRTNWNFLRTK
jgi:hypothetical protein